MRGTPWSSIEVGQRWSSDDGDVIFIVAPDPQTNRWIVRDDAGAIDQMNATEIRANFNAPPPVGERESLDPPVPPDSLE
jgi:hypothetical protein